MTTTTTSASSYPDRSVKSQPEDRVVPAFCGMCGPNIGCGIKAIVKGGKFVGVEPLEESPLSRGKLCGVAYSAPRWVYSPNRLTHPLKRVGKRGEGKFERISWDEAVTLVADKLKEQKEKYGPESLAILGPARRTYTAYFNRFLGVHGSPNYGTSGICMMQRSFGMSQTLGGFPGPDVEHTDLVVIWAANPVYAGTPKRGLREILDARARGAKVVAIKPTLEPDAAFADVWVPVRPGTDAALALAFLHVVVRDGLYDHPFVALRCHGFEALAEHVRQYTPEWAEKITGVEARQIEEVARLIATSRSACFDVGNGLEHATSSLDAIRSIASLIAITGNLDRKGGNVYALGRGAGNLQPKPVSRRSQFAKPEMVEKLVAPAFPRSLQPNSETTNSAYYGIIKSILTEKPYPIRTLIAPGTQPTVSNRGTKDVLAALRKVDFFVVIDVMETAELPYADVVIPVSTVYETDYPFETYGRWVMARRRVIDPLGDYKSDYEFWIDLAVKMGYGDQFWGGSMDAAMDDLLEPLGIGFEDLRRHPTGLRLGGPPPEITYENYDRVFATASPRLGEEPLLPEGKVALYNTTLERLGYSPLPRWTEPPESLTGTPELTARYPLVLSDFHTSKNYMAGWLRNVPTLREVAPHPTIQIHPKAAAERGLSDGDWVVVESPHGTMKVRAEVYPGIRPDTVMILHGWWQACQELGLPGYPLADGGANVNNMYSTDLSKAVDPVVWAISSQTLVQVRRAEDPAGAAARP
jgi:anaerobic selenocysteine-containing dehydrogenase